MALINVWPLKPQVVKEDGDYYNPAGEAVEDTVYVRRQKNAGDLSFTPPDADPILPFIPDEAIQPGLVNDDLSTVRGLFPHCHLTTIGRSSPGDGFAAEFFWDPDGTQSESVDQVYGIGEQGRWIVCGGTGGGGGVGAPGVPGTQWRVGSGAPSNDLGINGDLYLNTTTGQVYRRSAGLYAVVASLAGPAGTAGTPGAAGATGATGPAGTPGSTLRTGSGAPSNTLGINGDFYMDVQNGANLGNLYQKSGGTYSLIANLRGPQGAPGSGGGGSVSPLTENVDADGYAITDAGQFLPRVGSVAYAASVNIDVSARSEYAIAALTGNIAITLTNPVNGATVLIELRQDTTGGRDLTGITCSGRTIRMAAGAGTLQIDQTAEAITVLICQVKSDYVLVTRAVLEAAAYGADPGPSSGGPSLSNVAPPAIGTATPGDDATAARGGHSHALGGTVSGDLSGTLPNPTVARIQGRAISAVAPLDGQVLKYNGTAWAPANDLVGSGGGSGPAAWVTQTKTFASSITLNYNGVDQFNLTLTGDCTITAITNVPERGCRLRVAHSGGPHTLTWPWDVKRRVGETLAPHSAGVTYYELAYDAASSRIYASVDGSAAWEDNDTDPGSGGGGSYAPTDHATLIGWFKAASANVTIGSGNVNAWNDLSAQDNDAGAAVYGGFPAWVAADADYNGHDSVEFDRDGPEGMNANGVAADITGPFTVGVVCKFDSLVTAQAVWGMAGANGYIQMGMDPSGQLYVASEDTLFNFESGSVAHDGDPHVIHVVVTPKVGVTPGSVVVYVDGSAVSLSSSVIVTAGPFTDFMIGWRGGEALEGTIAEITVYNEALDASEVEEDADFLADGKGI